MNFLELFELGPVHLLGVMAGIMGLGAIGTQVVKSWISRSTRDLSLLALIVNVSSTLLWLIYGLIQADKALILSNIVGITLTTILLIFKLYFG